MAGTLNNDQFIGVVVGGSLGGAVIIASIIVVVCCFCTRRRKKDQKPCSRPPQQRNNNNNNNTDATIVRNPTAIPATNSANPVGYRPAINGNPGPTPAAVRQSGRVINDQARVNGYGGVGVTNTYPAVPTVAVVPDVGVSHFQSQKPIQAYHPNAYGLPGLAEPKLSAGHRWASETNLGKTNPAYDPTGEDTSTYNQVYRAHSNLTTVPLGGCNFQDDPRRRTWSLEQLSPSDQENYRPISKSHSGSQYEPKLFMCQEEVDEVQSAEEGVSVFREANSQHPPSHRSGLRTVPGLQATNPLKNNPQPVPERESHYNRLNHNVIRPGHLQRSQTDRQASLLQSSGASPAPPTPRTTPNLERCQSDKKSVSSEVFRIEGRIVTSEAFDFLDDYPDDAENKR